MEREQWNLDRKGDKESKKQPLASSSKIWHSAAPNRALNGHEIKATGLCIEPQNRGEHKDRGDHRVQKKLDRRIYPPSVPIDADQERHRNQRRFPEEIEQEQIERNKDPDQARLEYQQHNEEFLDPFMN